MSDITKLMSRLHVSPQPVLKVGKSDRTRAAILNAAIDFTWTHSFRDMTVNKLMASTGAGRSAFYQYFKDMHEVMATLLEILQADIFEASEPWVVGVGDPVTLLHESLTGWFASAIHAALLCGPLPMRPLLTSALKKPGTCSWVGLITRHVTALRRTRNRA